MSNENRQPPRGGSSPPAADNFAALRLLAEVASQQPYLLAATSGPGQGQDNEKVVRIAIAKTNACR
jgi:hypothetical protein